MSVSSQQTEDPLLKFKEELGDILQDMLDRRKSREETKSKFMSDVKAKILDLNGFCEELDKTQIDLNHAKQVLTDSLHKHLYLDEFERLVVDE